MMAPTASLGSASLSYRISKDILVGVITPLPWLMPKSMSPRLDAHGRLFVWLVDHHVPAWVGKLYLDKWPDHKAN